MLKDESELMNAPVEPDSLDQILIEPAESTTLTSRPIFLALQGGGAKGIVHVGALAAIEGLDFDIRGVAGTSAGSMVAALVAAGYKAEELVDAKSGNNFFKTVGARHSFHRPTDLFTGLSWGILKSARGTFAAKGALSNKISAINARIAGSKLCAKICRFIPVVPRESKVMARNMNLLFMLIIAVLGYYIAINYPRLAFSLLIILICLGVWIVNGITTVKRVRTLIDKALTDKLTANGYEVSDNVTFSDMKAAKCVPLKIVATNVAYECLELFCVERTPNVCVADAVAASICLPLIFRPWQVGFERITETSSERIEGRFLDGGIVSNLPAWPFDEERLLDPTICTVALSIESGKLDNAKHWMSAITRTIVNGSAVIHTRAAGIIVKVPLKTKLGMLAFDVSEADVYDLIAETELEVNTQLSFELVEGPRVLREAAEAIKEWFFNEVEQATAEWHRGHPGPKLRVAIAAERGGSMNALSNVFTSGFEEGHQDIRMTRRADGWLFNDALESGQPSFRFLLPSGSAPSIDSSEHVWSDARWVACFPLSHQAVEKNRVRNCVVVVDCNVPVDLTIPGAEQVLTLLLERAFEFVTVYSEDKGLMKTVQGANTWL